MDEEHVRILKEGVSAWNRWRTDNPLVVPDLSQMRSSRSHLRELDLGGINLSSARLWSADLSQANLQRANLSGARLFRTNFFSTNLSEANLTNANLQKANLGRANLFRANLRKSNLYLTDLSEANLDEADVSEAVFAVTKLIRVDLTTVHGLDAINHRGPSTLSVETLYRSAKSLSTKFLVGCGIPDSLITFLPSLIGAQEALQFYSCFISYSHDDEEFAKRLYSRMRDEHLRVWFAPEDVRGGEKLYDQIDRAIQVHDRLLIVLSDNSLKSEWVMTEIRRARKVEIREGRQKLFPIRLVSFEKLQEWTCFDAETGKDLAVEVREYFIPDFSNWKHHDSFEAAFGRLLKDLQAAK